MKSEYYWTFQIETSRFGGVMRPSCDYVTEENKEAWLRFVENKIREVMKPETMDSQEFKECLMYVEEEKRKREEYERREKELRIKHADERRRRSSMEKPKIAYIPKGLTVDYEKEYGRLIRQEVFKYYHDFRGLQKVMLQMMPSEPYVGEPVAVVREKSEEDLLLERKLKREEQQKLYAE